MPLRGLSRSESSATLCVLCCGVLHSAWEESIHSSVRERKREERGVERIPQTQGSDTWWWCGARSPARISFGATLFVATLRFGTDDLNGGAATRKDYHTYHHGVVMTDVMSPCQLSKLHVRGISCSVWLLIELRIPLLIGSQCRRRRKRVWGRGGEEWGGGGRGLSVFGAGFVCQPKIAHCGICLGWINGDCHVVIALAFFRLARQ